MLIHPLGKDPYYRFRSKSSLGQSRATLASFEISSQASCRSYENYLDRHLVTLDKSVTEKKTGSRRRRDATSVGRAALELYFFRDHQ
jgi:hypothetical protein